MSTDPAPPTRPAHLGDPAGAGTAETDSALMQRLRMGDASALDGLYRRHRGAVYRFALLWTGSPALAADVTQDVFMHLLTRPDRYDATRGAPLAWALGVARNFCRQRTGMPSEALAIDDESTLSEPALVESRTPFDVLAGRRDLDRLRSAITTLPPHYRDILVLTELCERSYVETALICGCELGTVRSRLARAKALLTQRLAPHQAPAAAL